MNNEPVAWVYLEKWMAGIAYPDECFSDEELKGTIPLYTHPAKTLTDEEILEVFVENYGDDILPNIQASGIEFANAILRKAQEK